MIEEKLKYKVKDINLAAWGRKEIELAEREFHSMDEAEIIDLLLMYVYEKMDDEAVELLHNDIFAER